MTSQQLQAALDLEVILPGEKQVEISTGYTSDLLSDIMANGCENCVLITIQAHVNTIAVASIIGAPAVIICNSRPVPQEMKDAAKREGIAIYGSSENQFVISYKVYALLNRKTE